MNLSRVHPSIALVPAHVMRRDRRKLALQVLKKLNVSQGLHALYKAETNPHDILVFSLIIFQSLNKPIDQSWVAKAIPSRAFRQVSDRMGRSQLEWR
jgi:hypothetical protein